MKTNLQKLTNLVKDSYADDLQAPCMLANIIDGFSIDDKKAPNQLYLEWTVEEFVGSKLKAVLPDLVAIHSWLKASRYGEGSAYEWNDCNNTAFYLPCDKAHVFCTTSQNRNYLFIMTLGDDGVVSEIHIRRYWNSLTPDDRANIKDECATVAGAVTYAEQMVEYFSDNMGGYRWVSRPDLKWWKACEFKPRYGDFRDKGYVASLDLWLIQYGGHTRVDGAMYYMAELGPAFLDIRCLVDLTSAESVV